MKLDYIGWQVAINYQAPNPEGLNYNYVKNVIDRSADSGMNFISFMPISYEIHCPEHDGYAWPVLNKKLEPLREKNCLNANPKTEFLSRALEYAKSKGMHCQLMMNSMLWNPEKVKINYPDANMQCREDGKEHPWLYCPDSPGGWRLALDEVQDLLEFYKDSPVDSFVFERMGYNSTTCYCPHSIKKFEEDTGESFKDSRFSFLIWKGNSMAGYLKKYIEHIKSARPGIEVWGHTGGEPQWGHFPHILKNTGIEIVQNHGTHFLKAEKAFHQQIDWLNPLDCVPHICVRDKRTHNYSSPAKTPQMIEEYVNWLKNYPGDRVKGAVFFNEVATTETNKAKVYDIVKKLRK